MTERKTINTASAETS